MFRWILLTLALLLLSLPAVAGTFYINNTGTPACSDVAAGTQGAPWCNAPGMANWTGSHTPVAGDSFIFIGGGTWGHTSFPFQATHSGNGTACALPYGSGATSSCIYFGVDKTYYTGASWTRPIMDCQLTSGCGSGIFTGHVYMLYSSGQYSVFDNLEFKGYFLDTTTPNGGNMVYNLAANFELKNIYIHGYSRSANTFDLTGQTVTISGNVITRQSGSFITDGVVSGSRLRLWGFTAPINGATILGPNGCLTSIAALTITVSAGCVTLSNETTTTFRYDIITAGTGASDAIATYTGGGPLLNTWAHDNVIDGSDTPGDMLQGIHDFQHVYNNYINHLPFGIGGYGDEIHDNTVLYQSVNYTGLHCDFYFNYSPSSGNSGNTVLFYNNVAAHSICTGGVNWFILALAPAGGCPGCTTIAYNNLSYDNDIDSSNGLPSAGGHTASGVVGATYSYGNVVGANGQACVGSGDSGGPAGASGPRTVIHYANNHCITSSSTKCQTGSGQYNMGQNDTNKTCAGNNCVLLTVKPAYMNDNYPAANTTAKFVNPGTINSPLSVSVTGNDITVNLATDGTGVLTSTGAQIQTAINADPTASTLVTASSGGSGVAAAVAKAYLNANSCVDDGTNLKQTVAQATTAPDDYLPSNGYQPGAANWSTVGTGTNFSSLLGTFGPAFGYSTSAGVGIDGTNHTVVVPALATAARPTLWDIGAYQFTNASPSPVLTAACFGTANGTVQTTQVGHTLSCTCTAGVASGTCTETHTSGDNITVTATATTGIFVGFTGLGCSTSPCSINNFTTSDTVSATFNLVPTGSLSMSKAICNPISGQAGCSPVGTVTVANATSWSVVDQANRAVASGTVSGTFTDTAIDMSQSAVNYTLNVIGPGGSASATASVSLNGSRCAGRCP